MSKCKDCGGDMPQERLDLGFESCKGCAGDPEVFGMPEFDNEGCIVGLRMTNSRKDLRAAMEWLVLGDAEPVRKQGRNVKDEYKDEQHEESVFLRGLSDV